jgi:hypothetical protein
LDIHPIAFSYFDIKVGLSLKDNEAGVTREMLLMLYHSPVHSCIFSLSKSSVLLPSASALNLDPFKQMRFQMQ